ncbi:uncharacterized protein LOC115878652 [Sitophilus oryzae]|uniref:Uncharacterized protein LOC115878652 n=1 Tax=Sitophilus oryzae TaxID=7048 RepID=A0A6J2XIX0_SITOR|nr:uncharacterized protein LOC115878652 [Sitophilus oryzae]
MGKGTGLNINLELILRLVVLILVIVALALFMTSGVTYSYSALDATDAMNISASIYIIITLIMLGLLLVKNQELEQGLAGVFLIVGALLLISSGIAVAVLVGIDDGDVVWLVSGIMAILGGVAMCVDALKTYGVF